MKLQTPRPVSFNRIRCKATVLSAAYLMAISAWAQAPGVWTPEAAASEPKALLGHTALSGLRLNMSGFAIEGNVLIDQEALARTLEPWLNRNLDLPAFEQAVHAVSQFLRANGHPNVVVKISRAMMRDGQLAVAIEGLSPRAIDYARVPTAEPVLPVRGFRFKGVTKASPQELESAVAPWSGKPLKVADLQAPADAVARLLRAKGYTLAQAFLPPQKLEDGMLEIEVYEGLVDTETGRGGVVVSGSEARVRPELIENILLPAVAQGQPLRPVDLENRLLVANEWPGVKVSADLEPGDKPGTTRILARVEEAAIATGQASMDNYGNRYTGEARGQFALNVNSLTGWGDQLQLQGTSSAHSMASRVGWSFPVGWDGARFGLAYSSSDLKLDTQIIPVNLDGRVRARNGFFIYPFIQTALQRMNLQASYEYRSLANTLDGQLQNERQVRVANLGLSYEGIGRPFDSQSWTVGLASGHVDNAFDQGGALRLADTAGRFNKVTVGMNFRQALSTRGEAARWRWQFGLSGQSVSRNLDTSEKFQLGGPTGVRAYPVGEAFGDEGYLANLELHREFGETPIGSGSVFGFADSGGVRLSKEPWESQLANGRPNSYNLHGLGLGVVFNPGQQSSMKLMWARKVGGNPNPTAANTDSDGSQSNTRIWLLGTYKF